MFNDDKKPNWKTGEKNIYKNANGMYCIRKTVDGKLRYFASFKELSDAVKYREYCKTHDWDMKCRRKRSNHMIYISAMEMEEGVMVV